MRYIAQNHLSMRVRTNVYQSFHINLQMRNPKPSRNAEFLYFIKPSSAPKTPSRLEELEEHRNTIWN